jgi:hypothetical protein
MHIFRNWKEVTVKVIRNIYNCNGVADDLEIIGSEK